MANSQRWGNAGVTTVNPRVARSPGARVRRWAGGSFAPYLFVGPFFLIFFGFFAYPVGYSFYVSLQHWAGVGPMRSVGLGNYAFVLSDNSWWGAVANTAALWLLIVPLGTTLSLILAVAWNRRGARGISVARVLYLLPAVSSIVAVSIVFRILLDQNAGPVDVILGLLHIPAVPWLTSADWSKPAIALVRLWSSVGLGALFFSSALQNIPREIYDAAAVDGCNPVRGFFAVTLPLLSRTILFVVITGTLATVGLFAEAQLITGGGPVNSSTTVALYLYNLVGGLDLGTASAVSFLMTTIMIVVSVALFIVQRRWQPD